jgi:hypothetical protein
VICDICLAPHEELWGFSVAGFYEPFTDVVNVAGEWGVCDECKLLIDARDAAGIVARVKTDSARVTRLIAPFYVMLIANITGPLVRIRDQTTPLYGIIE